MINEENFSLAPSHGACMKEKNTFNTTTSQFPRSGHAQNPSYSRVILLLYILITLQLQTIKIIATKYEEQRNTDNTQ